MTGRGGGNRVGKVSLKQRREGEERIETREEAFF